MTRSWSALILAVALLVAGCDITDSGPPEPAFDIELDGPVEPPSLTGEAVMNQPDDLAALGDEFAALLGDLPIDPDTLDLELTVIQLATRAEDDGAAHSINLVHVGPERPDPGAYAINDALMDLLPTDDNDDAVASIDGPDELMVASYSSARLLDDALRLYPVTGEVELDEVTDGQISGTLELEAPLEATFSLAELTDALSDPPEDPDDFPTPDIDTFDADAPLTLSGSFTALEGDLTNPIAPDLND